MCQAQAQVMLAKPIKKNCKYSVVNKRISHLPTVGNDNHLLGLSVVGQSPECNAAVAGLHSPVELGLDVTLAVLMR